MPEPPAGEGAVPALDVRALDVAYDGRPALAGVSLSVRPGEVVAVLGPSGSGKTTLLHAVAGFRPPSAGEVRLGGRLVADAAASEPPERRDVAVVFQHFALWPHLDAVDTVAYPLRRRGVGRAAARREALTLLHLLGVGHLASRRPAAMSGGEQQRVGLARALARRPALYLFDEPTAHLDTPVRALFLAELAERQRASGAAALYATHDAEEALAIADRVVLVRDGRVVQDGAPAQVYAEPVDLWAAQLTGPVSVLSEPTFPGGIAADVLVRPDWARLGGDRGGVCRQARFRGTHSDYTLATAGGDLLLREPGPPRVAPGDRVTWSLRHAWRPPVPTGEPAARPGTGTGAAEQQRRLS